MADSYEQQALKELEAATTAGTAATQHALARAQVLATLAVADNTDDLRRSVNTLTERIGEYSLEQMLTLFHDDLAALGGKLDSIEQAVRFIS